MPEDVADEGVIEGVKMSEDDRKSAAFNMTFSLVQTNEMGHPLARAHHNPLIVLYTLSECNEGAYSTATLPRFAPLPRCPPPRGGSVAYKSGVRYSLMRS